MDELINKNLLMEELHHMVSDDAEMKKDYEYMGIDDCIRSMPTTTEKEIRAKAIEEFAEAVKNRCYLSIDEIAKKLKGENDTMTKGEYMESQGMRPTINPKVLKEELDDDFKKFVDSMKANFDSLWNDDDSGDID